MIVSVTARQEWTYLILSLSLYIYIYIILYMAKSLNEASYQYTNAQKPIHMRLSTNLYNPELQFKTSKTTLVDWSTQLYGLMIHIFKALIIKFL